MEYRVTLEGGEGAAASLHRSLASAGWQVTPGPDGLRVRVEDGRGLSEFVAAVRAWEASLPDEPPVRATVHGPGYVVTRVGADHIPLPEADEVAPLDSHASSEPYGEATPPGPVLDPDDDWPRN